MARVWSSGFELNSLAIEFTSTAGAALSVQSSVARSGTYAAKIASLSSGTRSSAFFSAWSAAATQGNFTRIGVRFDTLPTAENTFSAIVSANTVPAGSICATVDSGGVVRLYEIGGVGLLGTTSALATGVFHRLEILYELGANNFTTGLMNGVQFAARTQTNGDNPVGFVIGGNLQAEAQTQGVWYFDDLAVNDDSGTSQNSYPGAGSIVHLYPNALGDFAEAGGTGGSAPITGAGNEWQNVAEVTPDDGVSYWFLDTASANSTSTDRLDVACADFTPSAASITLVQVGIRMQPASNASCTYVTRIKSQASGTIIESAAIAVTGTVFVTHDDTVPKTYKLTRYTDPQAGGVWTTALLNSIQIGVRSTDVTPNPRITSLWALVEYVPANIFLAPLPFTKLQAVKTAAYW